MQLTVFLKEVAAKLTHAHIENANREARLLAAHLFDCSYEEIFFTPNREISQKHQEALNAFVERRIQGESLAKIVGRKEFWGLNFYVTKDTLDPRPDSETLITTMLKHCPNRTHPYKVLDLGTGSGCLIISALTEYVKAQGWAVDKSLAALKVARANAETLGVNSRCFFIQGDWCTALNEKFDIILLNPPYISLSEKLFGDVLCDPFSALFSGHTGLDDYQRLGTLLPAIMDDNSLIFMEIGASQAQSVSEILYHNNLTVIEIAKDINCLDRCLIVKKK